ncbi:Uncharacterised protein [Mycobacteroides abscessus]|nr:Uncharacterised protein [Mycobacteroides abscessus]
MSRARSTLCPLACAPGAQRRATSTSSRTRTRTSCPRRGSSAARCRTSATETRGRSRSRGTWSTAPSLGRQQQRDPGLASCSACRMRQNSRSVMTTPPGCTARWCAA